ncbi:uncharacterized protein LOC141639111 isoform X2 [Silene latifolia]|uniref:uncharacterized protein LOC141639111 isoform X2 n=2 Tax=Silene latifolia TaxID=37657 RepID=UPI003D77ADEC
MGVNMIRWRPWPPIKSKKYEVKIVVRCITGLPTISDDNDEKIRKIDDGFSKLKVEINWKGCKTNGFRSFRKKSLKKNSTTIQSLSQNGVVQWDEEFTSVCGFCGSKDKIVDGVFLPWEITFYVFNMDAKKKGPLATPAVVNLADFVSLEGVNEMNMDIPLSIVGCNFKCCPSLCISLQLTELKPTNEPPGEVQRPILFAPLSPCFGGPSPSINKEEGSTFKAGMRKVKSMTNYVSSKKSKKACHGEVSSDSKFSTGSDSDDNYPFDTDSFDDSEEGESEESKENISVEKSCGYGNLVHVNLAGRALDLRVNCEDDELVYYSNKRLDVDSSPTQDLDTSVSEQLLRQSPKFGILAWRKRKLSFKAPRVKGEPLLKKDYREEGGDDIDFDRRQLSLDESTTCEESVGSGSLFSEFGDDNFAVGSWELKELSSRDGSMKLRTQVFFASIDQRSERAAGESACTALVAVIADWLHTNRGEMPIKSDFDTLIREGSLQWRNLCENEDYKERFPDKHFDLETVLQAKIRPLAVIPERSFIGFFHPEGLEDESFHFLKDAMSFDDIWGEICQAALNLNHASEPLVYVVSWNDHFFLLRVDCDAFYLIDTLGERLFEGNNQAFVLKFDEDTTIERAPVQTSQKDERDNDGKFSKEKTGKSEPVVDKSEHASPVQELAVIKVEESGDEDGMKEDDMVMFRGKECCKEYIKSFLAAIPIRELQVDMKKGLISSTPLHARLQIEIHYTASILPTPNDIAPVATANVEASIAVDVQNPMTCDLQTSMMTVVAA